MFKNYIILFGKGLEESLDYRYFDTMLSRAIPKYFLVILSKLFRHSSNTFSSYSENTTNA